MAKALMTQLKEAIKAGNVHLAGEIMTKMEEPTPKKTTKTAKKSPAKRSTKPTAKPTAKPEASEYHDPRANQNLDGGQTYSKTVPLDFIPKPNKFNPADYGSLPSNQEKADKAIKKIKAAPRTRAAVKKVKVRCTSCNQDVEVYPEECATVDGQSNFRCSKRGCVKH